MLGAASSGAFVCFGDRWCEYEGIAERLYVGDEGCGNFAVEMKLRCALNSPKMEITYLNIVVEVRLMSLWLRDGIVKEEI